MKILDCTLRDGSYVIHFGFTATDTAEIAGALDRAGFEYIEVGHGVGFNASKAGYGEAAETDEAYLKAAAENVKRGKFGAFCIPGIARLEDVDMAAEYGMGFIRIGTNVTEVETAAPFLARAREHGMFACANLMKSYAMEPSEFADVAHKAESFGAETIYIVDSAGGMLPEELARYIRAVRARCSIPVAFHGHDNLGLAIGNSIEAVRLGAEIVDASLQGFGRSAGNAATEILVAVLTRMGHKLPMDPIEVMDIGEALVRPLVTRRGIPSMDVVSGLAQFHSSYMGIIRTMSSRYRVDPRKLILEVCKLDRVNAPAELVERCARQLQSKGETRDVLTSRFHFEDYFGDEQVDRRPKN